MCDEIKIFGFWVFILYSTFSHVVQENIKYALSPLNASLKIPDIFLALLKIHHISWHFIDVLAKFIKFLTISDIPDIHYKMELYFSILETGFRWCESQDSFNFMSFSGGILVLSSGRPFISTLMFWYIKGFQVVYIRAKLHLCLIDSSRYLKFQMFSHQ